MDFTCFTVAHAYDESMSFEFFSDPSALNIFSPQKSLSAGDKNCRNVVCAIAARRTGRERSLARLPAGGLQAVHVGAVNA